jgi:hypothetical protein
MTRFYQEKYNLSHVKAGFLAQCVAHIQSNIIKRFGISSPTPELMRDTFEVWLDAITLPQEKAKYRAMFKDGLEYYLKILNYQVSSTYLFQVKNNDITKLGFVWYKNGQRVSALPQTFEFFNKGGFTIDYSVGIAINGLVNHAFTTIGFDTIMSGDTITKYRVTRQRGSSLNIGPVLLAHAYYRYPIWNRFKIGATTGFMTNTRDNDFGFNFLFGASYCSAARSVLTLPQVLCLEKWRA